MIYQNTQIKTKLKSDHFKESYWVSSKQSSYLSGGRGSSIKFDLDNKSYVLRHYLRGGFVAKWLYDQYIWKGEKNSRVFQECKILNYAIKEKLTVPQCIAYNIDHHGFFYRQSIILSYIPNQGTLADILNQRALTEDEWLRLASVIKDMHITRISHADLNANNILLGQDKLFYIIDFDKAKIMKNNKHWPSVNIQRLYRSLLKLNPKYFSEQGWLILKNQFTE